MQQTRPSPHTRLPYLLFAFFLALALMPASAFGQAGPPAGVGEEDEAAHDLSVPVIWLGDETLVTDVVDQPLVTLGEAFFTDENGTEDPSDDIHY